MGQALELPRGAPLREERRRELMAPDKKQRSEQRDRAGDDQPIAEALSLGRTHSARTGSVTRVRTTDGSEQ